MDMNPFTAAAIFIPLSMAISYAANSYSEAQQVIPAPVKMNVEAMKELNIKPEKYFLYLKYDSCVKAVSRKSNANGISSDIKYACNPILDKR